MQGMGERSGREGRGEEGGREGGRGGWVNEWQRQALGKKRWPERKARC